MNISTRSMRFANYFSLYITFAHVYCIFDVFLLNLADTS